MSSLRSIDLRLVAELVEFVRGAGYVLDFSDSSFSEFFANELNVDIDDPQYSDNGSSKGKRLRSFLTKADNHTAVQTLSALWEHRSEHLNRLKLDDPVQNATGRYLGLLARLSAQNSRSKEEIPIVSNRHAEMQLKDQLVSLHSLNPQSRGFAFERFLKDAFELYGLKAREPFRNIGEQIDGSFLLDAEIYLLEAKWTRDPVDIGDLNAFHGKCDKAAWTRGMFVSYNGFSELALQQFGTAKRLVCVEGKDIFWALERQIQLPELLRAKVRHAGETGHPFVPIDKLFP